MKPILPLNPSNKELDRFVWKDDSVKTDPDLGTQDSPRKSNAAILEWSVE